MKNAYVIEDHHGDDGTVTEGMILRDVATKRFDELEAKGLVREATAAEVKKGFQPKIDADESKKDGDGDGDADDKKDGDGDGKKKPEPDNKKAPDAPNKGA